MFTRQELIYLALGARTLAKQSKEEAAKCKWGGIKPIHEAAAQSYEGLAQKCERLAKTASSPRP